MSRVGYAWCGMGRECNPSISFLERRCQAAATPIWRQEMQAVFALRHLSHTWWKEMPAARRSKIPRWCSCSRTSLSSIVEHTTKKKRTFVSHDRAYIKTAVHFQPCFHGHAHAHQPFFHGQAVSRVARLFSIHAACGIRTVNDCRSFPGVVFQLCLRARLEVLRKQHVTRFFHDT